MITRKLSDLLYQIKDGQQKRSKVLHHDRLKPFVSDDVPMWVKKLQQQVREKEEEPTGTEAPSRSTQTQDTEDIQAAPLMTETLPSDDKDSRPAGDGIQMDITNKTKSDLNKPPTRVITRSGRKTKAPDRYCT